MKRWFGLTVLAAYYALTGIVSVQAYIIYADSPYGSAVNTVSVARLRHEHAVYRAAYVYGRVGCGNYHLAELTARKALEYGIDPGLVAALIGLESFCEVTSVGKTGDLGLMQIHVKTWRTRFDFTKSNLLHAETNLDIGCKILSEYIGKYGLPDGVRRYNSANGDGVYAKKILALAGAGE